MLENKRKKSNIKLEIADNETIMTQEQGIIVNNTLYIIIFKVYLCIYT